jgi:hypothetical protein
VPSPEEIDRVIAAIRAGSAPIIGGSRQYSTYQFVDGKWLDHECDEAWGETHEITETILRERIAADVHDRWRDWIAKHL